MGWLSGWSQRQALSISNFSSEYQVLLDLSTINWDSIASDGADLRVCDADGTTLLPIWLEEFDYGAQTGKLWIKLPSVHSGDLYLYTGNSSATSVSDGESVFEFFDDFEDGILDTNKWDYSGTPVEENGVLKLEGGSVRSNPYFSVGVILEFYANSEDKYDSVHGFRGSGNAIRFVRGAVYPEHVDTIVSDIRYVYGSAVDLWPGWHTFRIVWKSDGAVCETEDGVAHTFSSGQTPTADLAINFYSGGANNPLVTFEWVFVRKYVSPEPSLTAGAVEKKKSIQDSGSGADNIARISHAFLSIQDSGAGTDSISKIEKLYKLISDLGAGSDVLSPLAKISAKDSGAGAELLSLLARLSLQDSGSGVDLLPSILQKIYKTVFDSGVGQDLIASILAQLVISDSASASEVLSSLAKLSVSDVGVGIDTVLGQFQKIVADSGSGVDVLTAFVEVLVQEAGQGIEAILRRASYQYKGGTVTLVKGSPTVIGTGTSWLGQVRAGDLFKVKGENALYVVSSVESDTELTLSSNYVGESRTNVSYIIHRFFTANYLLPILTGKTGEYEGDEDWSEFYKYAIRKIDKLLKNLGA